MTYQEINSNLSIELLPNEIFKDIPDYEGLYQVSNLGRVKSLERIIKDTGINRVRIRKEQILKSFIQRDNYLLVNFYKNNKRKCFTIHRLVLLAFKGFSNLDCNHINGIKIDNRLENFVYCTKSENMFHAYRLGLKKITQTTINNGTILYKKYLKKSII